MNFREDWIEAMEKDFYSLISNKILSSLICLQVVVRPANQGHFMILYKNHIVIHCFKVLLIRNQINYNIYNKMYITLEGN